VKAARRHFDIPVVVLGLAKLTMKIEIEEKKKPNNTIITHIKLSYFNLDEPFTDWTLAQHRRIRFS
jgi:hypothetical protein